MVELLFSNVVTNSMRFSAENGMLGAFWGGEDFWTLAYDFWLETICCQHALTLIVRAASV